MFVQKADSVQSIQSCLWLYFEMMQEKKGPKKKIRVQWITTLSIYV